MAAEDVSSEIVKEMAESVAASNLKVVGELPAYYTGLAMGNAVSNQQQLNQLAMAIVSKAAESILATSPSESGGDVATLAQLMKGVQLTPPQA